MDVGQYPIDPGLLNDVLPVGVIVTDTSGVVRHTNLRAAELTGYERDELIGRSLLEFIGEDDIGFIADSLGQAVRYGGQVMGPARLKYRDRFGTEKWTEYWAFGCPPAFGFEGYVITMSTESVSDNLAQAVREIAAGAPIESCMATIARSVAAYPLTAVGAVLLRGRNDLSVVGSWPFDDQLIRDPAMPWHGVLTTGTPLDLDVADLPDEIGVAAGGAGYKSMWIRPVRTGTGRIAAVFLAWREEAVGVSANQERHLTEVLRVARLAFDHHEHRTRLQDAALVDSLTGLGNRFHLTQRLGSAGPVPEAVLYIDLDGFKNVNDTFGHDVGDRVLILAGKRIAALVRDRDGVFRMGGDEFVVICEDLSQPDSTSAAKAASAIAERIVNALAMPFEIGSHDALRIGASVGVATRRPDESGEQLINRSDRALLQAKNSGKSRWHLSDDE